MEIFGILFSIPGAAIASWLYLRLLVATVTRYEWISTPFLIGSCVVMLSILAEWSLLVTLGVLGVCRALGPSYEALHLVNFLFGAPAMVNLLALRNIPQTQAGYAWYVVPAATLLAFVLVLQQYAVSEAMHGIDGVGGPYGPAKP